MKQNKIKQNWKGAENFDNCLFVILITFTNVLFLEEGLDTRLSLHPTTLWIMTPISEDSLIFAEKGKFYLKDTTNQSRNLCNDTFRSKSNMRNSFLVTFVIILQPPHVISVSKIWEKLWSETKIKILKFEKDSPEL